MKNIILSYFSILILFSALINCMEEKINLPCNIALYHPKRVNGDKNLTLIKKIIQNEPDLIMIQAFNSSEVKEKLHNFFIEKNYECGGCCHDPHIIGFLAQRKIFNMPDEYFKCDGPGGAYRLLPAHHIKTDQKINFLNAHYKKQKSGEKIDSYYSNILSLTHTFIEKGEEVEKGALTILSANFKDLDAVVLSHIKDLFGKKGYTSALINDSLPPLFFKYS